MEDDDMTADMMAGFEARYISSHQETMRSNEADNAEFVDARAEEITALRDEYPDVDVDAMVRDRVDRNPLDTKLSYLRKWPAAIPGRDMAQAVVGGARDGLQEAHEVLQMVGFALSGQKHLLNAPTVEEVKADTPDLPEIPVSGGGPEALTRGLAQFFSVGGPAGALAKKLGASALGASMAGGAAGDAVAMNPAEGNLSTLMRELGIENDFTAFMDSSDDGQFEGRVKNAMEGAGIGLAFEGVLKSLKSMKPLGTGSEDDNVDD